MKALIITVAGTATRFNRDTASPTLKCLYHVGGLEHSILYRLIHKSIGVDFFVIVGGYLYTELVKAIDSEVFRPYKSKIKLVYNPEFATRGSMESLFLGIEEARHLRATEIVFAEGDLVLGTKEYLQVLNEQHDVITVNSETIDARRSVVMYVSESGKINYLYDLGHKNLSISEPFLQIHNSGQVWKFQRSSLCYELNGSLSIGERSGTNLVLIQKYFQALEPSSYRIIKFNKWFNCNTVDDYNHAMQMKEEGT